MSSPPDSQRGVTGPPSEVHVTVFRLADEHALHRRLGRELDWIWARLRLVAVVVLPLAIGGVLLAAVLGVGSRTSPGAAAGVTDAGPAGVAAAYGYPSACLKVRISEIDPSFARADFGRAGSCGLHGGFPTALFHRFGGEWHPLLYAVTYPCPMPSVPAPVQRQLSVCPRRATRAGS